MSEKLDLDALEQNMFACSLCAVDAYDAIAKLISRIRELESASQPGGMQGEEKAFETWFARQDARTVDANDKHGAMAGWMARAAISQPRGGEAEDIIERFKNPMTPYGMLIRALRIVAGTTLMDMANQLCVTPAYLSAREFGRRPVSREDVIAASGYFHGLGIPGTLIALECAHGASIAAPSADNCGHCHTCAPITMDNMRMILCEKCGNKRCPHANDHRNACTGSNEPGQPGSAYPSAPSAGNGGAEG